MVYHYYNHCNNIFNANPVLIQTINVTITLKCRDSVVNLHSFLSPHLYDKLGEIQYSHRIAVLCEVSCFNLLKTIWTFLRNFVVVILTSLFKINFRSLWWGSSLTVYARLTVCSSPHQHKRKFSGTHVVQSHLQTSPPTPQKSYPKFRNPRTTFENTPLFTPKYSIVRGVGGVPKLFFWLES